MKNLLFLFIISIIISIIAACKDDVIYINNPDTISLNVTTNKFITKGIPINSATDSLFTSFGIFAYQTDNDFDLSDIPSQYYSVFSNKTANRNSSNNWLFDITYYWPQYGQLTFFAYAPYTSDTAYGMKIHENPGGIPYIRYNVPLDPAQQPDIMVAVTQENLSRVEVPVDFKHALSCIGFNVTADTLKVDSIWISGVSLSGSLYLNYTDSVIWSDLGEVSKDTCIAGLTDNCIAYESGSQIMASDGYLMMIPQTLSDSACMNIKFENIDTKTVYFKNVNIDKWVAGEKYTYVLKEGLYTFNVEVDAYSCDFSGGDLNFTINSIYTPPGKDAIDNQWTVWVSPDNADISWLGDFSQLGGSGGLNQERTLKIGTAPYNVSGANSYDKDLYNADSITKSLIRDLSYDSINNNYNSANCYMVNAPGWHKFPCHVIGNGLYQAASSADAPNNANCFPSSPPYFLNYEDEDITSLSNLIIPTSDATVSLLWENAPGLITDIAFSDDLKYIEFNVPKSTIRQGNAIIVIRDETKNKIMWSWHIWVTPVLIDFSATSTSEYPAFFHNNIGMFYKSSYEYEKREIKLVFTQTGSNLTQDILITQFPDTVKIGYTAPYFQWGRKDPMLGSDGTNNSDLGYGPTPFTIKTTEPVSIATTIHNPYIFYAYSGNWCAEGNDNLWAINTDYYKTIYDPCPPKMKTPSKSVMDSLSVGAGWHIYDDFGEYSFTYPSDVLGGISGIWLPALGCRAESSGSISGVNTIGYYWLSTQVGFKFDQSTTSNFTFTTGEAYGFCVTPIYE